MWPPAGTPRLADGKRTSAVGRFYFHFTRIRTKYRVAHAHLVRLMLSSMENYTIKEQIGKGAQAIVYIVERQQDKKLFVLKKVECFDESEANKAFKEATILQNLQHVYVSGYNEFFVLWEQQDSSVYICILMDYFPNGTLEDILTEYRGKKEVIEEQKIKFWLGQIIEGLVYVHKKNIIHRDVRPTNLFMKEDHTLCLGDFGVNTIMGDAVTCTRANAASMNYMAPEAASEGYTEKSDMWSLGCVLFELVTALLYSQKEAIDKLQEIRKNPDVLDYVFEEISKACVEMSDSTQLEKRKRIQSASTKKSEIGIPHHIYCYLDPY
ncbi:hypothetical protein DPMN_154742 [Dreissena polymorpha]|uniref:non-specific serine/threonine protein kinase n=1 Tax=Dreissena polymorpha TaxID=45954 RepID=A0A9D4JAP6_DREPO|nr:hypothetical protein DPMN_154742 [Dreissena polymorpha]